MATLQLTRPRLGAALSTRQLAILAVGLAVTGLVPLFANDYWTRLLVFVFINISLASAWNLIGGFTGYASFGHGVFFGIGAFAAAIGIVRYQLPLPVVMVIGGAVAAAVAALFVPVFKQKGLYFALSTLAVMLVFDTAFQRWSFTRGLRPHDLGWSVTTTLTVNHFYFLFLALLGGVLATVILVVNSRIGYALHAIRKDETLASSIGIRTIKYKSIAFMISAAWPGVIGAAFAPFLSFVAVQSVFDVNITLNMILISIFGGAGTIVGPVIGGIGLSVIDQIAWGNFLEYHRLINGALIVAVITLYPGGLVSLVRSMRERVRAAKARRQSTVRSSDGTGEIAGRA
jgi:branched-chain amino acid transport system permease protein